MHFSLESSEEFSIFLAVEFFLRSILRWFGLDSTNPGPTGSSTEYEKIVERSFDLFLRLDDRLNVVEVRHDTVELLGLPRNRLIGKRLDQFLETKNYRELRAELKSESGTRRIEFSDHLIRSTESSIPVEMELIPIDRESFVLVGRDLRDEVELGDEILQRQEQFRQLVRNLETVFWMRDTDGNALYVSPQYEDIWERSLDDFQEDVNAFADAIIEEDLDRVRSAIPEMETGQYDMEYRIETPDGDRKWIHDRAFPIRNAEGEVYRIGGLAEEITAEKKLREKYRQIYHNVNDAIALFDPETIEIVDCNEPFAETLGYTRDQVLGMDFEDYSLTEAGYDRARASEIIDELANNDSSSQSFEWVGVGQDGERYIFEVNASLADIAGSERVLTISRDVSDRKRKQEKIEFQRELLEVILETSNEGVLAINEDREIIAYNERFQSLWDLPDHVLREKTDEEALELAREQVENPEEFYRNVQEAYQQPDERITNELHFRDGRIIKQYSRSMIYDGAYQGRVWYFQDVTEERETQEQLEASLAEKETLLQEIHHRVKNNMQVISSLINLQFQQHDDPAVRETVDDILNRIRSMAITHEMLYQSDDFAALDLESYLSQLTQHLFSTHSSEAPAVDYAMRIDDASITLEQAISCGLIVTELVTNSLQHGFSEDDSGRIEVEFNQSSKQSELVVRDNGRGLPESFDLGESDSLGLQLVDSLVHSDLEGEYDVVSERGVEVVVRFQLRSADG